MSGRTKVLIVIAVVVVLGLGAGGAAWYFSWQSGRVDRFKKSLTAEWKTIEKKTADVTSAVERVSSAQELAALSKTINEARKRIATSLTRAKSKPPGSDDKTITDEKSALTSLDSYLLALAKLSSQGDKAKFMAGTSVLDDAAFKARLDTTTFLSSVPYMKVNLPGDFFQAGTILRDALNETGTRKGDIRAILAVVNSFMTADVKDFNMDTIWSLLSARTHAILDAFQIKKDKLGANWQSSRSGKTPTSFYVVPDITFTGPDSAVLKAIMYYKQTPPRKEEMKIVREPDGWKLDGYKFHDIP